MSDNFLSFLPWSRDLGTSMMVTIREGDLGGQSQFAMSPSVFAQTQELPRHAPSPTRETLEEVYRRLTRIASREMLFAVSAQARQGRRVKRASITEVLEGTSVPQATALGGFQVPPMVSNGQGFNGLFAQIFRPGSGATVRHGKGWETFGDDLREMTEHMKRYQHAAPQELWLCADDLHALQQQRYRAASFEWSEWGVDGFPKTTTIGSLRVRVMPELPRGHLLVMPGLGSNGHFAPEFITVYGQPPWLPLFTDMERVDAQMVTLVVVHRPFEVGWWYLTQKQLGGVR